MSSTMRQYQPSDGSSASMDHAIQSLKDQKQSHKRKRTSPDHSGHDRIQPGPRSRVDDRDVHGNGHDMVDATPNYFENGSNASADGISSISHRLAHHVASANVMPSTTAAAIAASMPQLTVPQPTELSFPTSSAGNDDDRQLESSFDMGPSDSHARHEGPPYNLDTFPGDAAGQMQSARETPGNMGNKPAVGSEEWHKVRKDNHKEVERRRRETINEGINELAKIVPGCDKNKGAILQRGVSYITQLKDNEATNIEKWTLEKLLTDQAIAELSSSVDKLKSELDRAYQEVERWKSTCHNAGLDPGGTDGDP